MAKKTKPKEKEDKGFYRQALDRVIERMDASGLPWPEKPKDYGSEYEFPADLSGVSGGFLGKLQGRLAGWEGYASRLLSLADVDLSLLQTSFDIALDEKMSDLQTNGSKGKLKNILKAQALAAEPALKKAAYALAERKALVSVLKAQKGIYAEQRQAVSREQSRRSDEMRARLRSD